VERADELGLEGYLEATMIGRRLYEKFGFHVVDKAQYDVEKYGKEGLDETIVKAEERAGM
jgi:hypothetical protein